MQSSDLSSFLISFANKENPAKKRKEQFNVSTSAEDAKEYIKKLQHGRFEVKDETEISFNFCVLPNNEIVSISTDIFNFYDQNFELVNAIFAFTNFMRISGIAYNAKRKQIYVSDAISNKVAMLDSEFRVIEETVAREGSGKTQFNGPTEVCCNDDTLYVHDSYNKRIQMLTTEDLEFLGFKKLPFNPDSMACTNEALAVFNEAAQKLYFYNPDMSKIVRVYDYPDASVSVLNNQFFVYCSSKKTINCYNASGEQLTETIDVTRLDIDEKHAYVYELNQKLHIAAGSPSKFYGYVLNKQIKFL